MVKLNVGECKLNLPLKDTRHQFIKHNKCLFINRKTNVQFTLNVLSKTNICNYYLLSYDGVLVDI